MTEHLDMPAPQVRDLAHLLGVGLFLPRDRVGEDVAERADAELHAGRTLGAHFALGL